MHVNDHSGSRLYRLFSLRGPGQSGGERVTLLGRPAVLEPITQNGLRIIAIGDSPVRTVDPLIMYHLKISPHWASMIASW